MTDTTPHDAVRAAVLTVSDRSAAGERPDDAGPVAVAALRASGFACDDALVVADGADSVAAGLRRLLAGGARLVVTSGGTGIAPRDQTPEGTMRVIDRTLPGIAEELRRQSAAVAPGALLSRGVAGVSGTALIVNLPGSPKAVAEGMPLVLSLARHALDQLTGGDHCPVQVSSRPAQVSSRPAQVFSRPVPPFRPCP